MGGCFNDLMGHSKDSFHWEPWRLSERYEAAILQLAGIHKDCFLHTRLSLCLPCICPRNFSCCTFNIAHFQTGIARLSFSRALLHILTTPPEDFFFLLKRPHTQTLLLLKDKKGCQIFVSLPPSEFITSSVSVPSSPCGIADGLILENSLLHINVETQKKVCVSLLNRQSFQGTCAGRPRMGDVFENIQVVYTFGSDVETKL